MASCNSYALTGIANGCNPNKGGISEVYIAQKDDVSGITIDDTTATTSTHMVSGITMVTGKKFKTFQFRKNTGYMNSTLNITDEGGNYISTELYLQFSRMETSKRLEMRALSLNDMVCIVKDSNQKYWLLGLEDPVVASTGNGVTGTNREDSNNYNITLVDESTNWPYEVPASILADIIDAAPTPVEG